MSGKKKFFFLISNATRITNIQRPHLNKKKKKQHLGQSSQLYIGVHTHATRTSRTPTTVDYVRLLLDLLL